MNSGAILLPDGKLQLEMSVPSYFTDSKFTLKPSSFMDIAQEMAYKASDRLGFGYDVLMEKKAAWVLSRMRFDFFSAPKWRDRIVARTWHKGTAGPFYLRDFSISDTDGNVLVAATSSWLVIDVEKRSIARGLDIDGLIPEGSICREDAISENASKLVCRGEFTPAGVHKVAYSDVDLLGHSNNAKYVQWALDCLDYKLLKDQTVSSVEVNFNHETHPGDEVSLGLCRQGDDIFFVEGTVCGRQSFCTKISLRQCL